MKKQTFLLLFVLLSTLSFAQINLEHTYTTGFVAPIKIDATDYRYIIQDTTNDQVSIYNIDYSLDTKIQISRPSGYHAGSYTAYKGLFNNSNAYNVTAFFLDPKTNIEYLYIYNADGSILFKSDPGYVYSSFINTTAGTKMILRNITQSVEIYSLSGHSFTAIKPANNDSININAYPNPASDHLIIANSRNNLNGISNIIIADIKGQIVKSLAVSRGESNVDIDTQFLPDGLYTYTVTNGTETETGKFLVAH